MATRMILKCKVNHFTPLLITLQWLHSPTTTKHKVLTLYRILIISSMHPPACTRIQINFTSHDLRNRLYWSKRKLTSTETKAWLLPILQRLHRGPGHCWVTSVLVFLYANGVSLWFSLLIQKV